MMKYTYCKKWSLAQKRPIDIWEEAAARLAHEERQRYSIVAGDIHNPYATIEIVGNYIGVEFLDAELREYLSYQFQELEQGRLFLTMATHREFQKGNDVVASGTTYIFKPDGVIDIEDEDFLAGTKSTRQIEADVSINWERYPSFGEYSSLLRVERATPLSG